MTEVARYHISANGNNAKNTNATNATNSGAAHIGIATLRSRLVCFEFLSQISNETRKYL